MLAPITSADSVVSNLVTGPWYCCRSAPGSVSHPDQLDTVVSEWVTATVPGTVAGNLNAAGEWDMQQPPSIDQFDWWYRTEFSASDECNSSLPAVLHLEGLATLAEVFLNGQRLVETDNMFRQYQVDVSNLLHEDNELVIGFRSMTQDLQKKRPRPRWKTNLVNHQQLRWRRTTLLGRIPGWSPPVPAIGLWRPIRLEVTPVSLNELQVHTSVEGSTGIVSIRAKLQSIVPVDQILLRVGDRECQLDVPENGEIHGELSLPDVPLWWPHTHGQQPLFRCQLVIEAGSLRREFDCGQLGFRQLKVDPAKDFAIELNGQPIYCRGACWTVSDVMTLHVDEEALRRDLTLARDAGANMLRVIGTMVYESDTFYRLCDELGILVWQDFMFANMDYPTDDATFSATITAEAIDQLRRLSSHPCVTVYCGNSEVEQQAAMLGMPRELWRNSWFAERLPALCAEHHSGTAYIPSTPSGGVLPFHASSGVSHFYGVGAYLRSSAELRQADVKFTSECLGFANIPEPETVREITGGANPVIHHPVWKQRVPRDSGAGWDFEDVRDHYLKQIYGVDPVLLRSTDMPRYMELSRVISGEMMSQTFAEWRSNHSHNRGGLVWFFKDLWPAAGWGVVDSLGMPKAAYYFLKRIWQTQQITITDEGLNGLHLHLTNELDRPLNGFVEVSLLKEPATVVASAEVPVELNSRGRQLLNADQILGGFYDVSYAYRFGPAHHDVVVATLLDPDRNVVSEAFHFVRRRESIVAPAAVETSVEIVNDTEFRVTLKSDRFLHNVRISADGYLADDNYFHLPPRRTKVLHCKTIGKSPKPFSADVEALNLETPITVSARNRG